MKERNQIRCIAMMVLLKNHQGKRPSDHTSEVQRGLAYLPGSSVIPQLSLRLAIGVGHD